MVVAVVGQKLAAAVAVVEWRLPAVVAVVGQKFAAAVAVVEWRTPAVVAGVGQKLATAVVAVVEWWVPAVVDVVGQKLAAAAVAVVEWRLPAVVVAVAGPAAGVGREREASVVAAAVGQTPPAVGGTLAGQKRPTVVVLVFYNWPSAVAVGGWKWSCGAAVDGRK